MEIEQLRIFLAVAECGSFTKGAAKLYISHSTTSRAVSALEEELGVKLLERDNRVHHLTTAGSILVAEAEKIVAAVDSLPKKIESGDIL